MYMIGNVDTVLHRVFIVLSRPGRSGLTRVGGTGPKIFRVFQLGFYLHCGGLLGGLAYSLHDTMNRLKRLAAVLLNSAEDPEQTHAALEAAGVPVSFADCRHCPNPCEDGKPALVLPPLFI